MNASSKHRRKPKLIGWHLLVVATATLWLCSCQNPAARKNQHQNVFYQPPGNAPAPAPLPSPAPLAINPHAIHLNQRAPVRNSTAPIYDMRVIAASYAQPMLPPQTYLGPPVANHPTDPRAQWSPPGIPKPWPHDEYLYDGGDKDVGVVVDPDWTVRGLDLEDTVGHFDTLDGRTLVTASNRVAIYAPRFAAVRKVYGLKAHDRFDQLVGVDLPIQLQLNHERSFARTNVLQEQPTGQIGSKALVALRDTIGDRVADNTQHLGAFKNIFELYEDFQIIRLGVLQQSEKVRLTERIDAALVWEKKQAVQVIVEGKPVSIQKGLAKPQETSRSEDPPGDPQMRVIKVASRADARPGEIVDFTIRFDNIGDELIGNVTIIDNLTTRLELVPDSAQCSLKAEFKTAENDGQSLVLRWEITDPMKVGQGGIIRFKCRVR